ncbi:hypothetical protein RAD15_07060 [Bradyrhizobium sp. 14AA]
MASVVLALEDGFRPHRLIDLETPPADSFFRAITDLRRRTGSRAARALNRRSLANERSAPALQQRRGTARRADLFNHRAQ